MDDYTAATYGDRVADVYDEWYPPDGRAGDADQAVAFLRSLTDAGPALELGIGTGRIALPLSASGVEVHGIDASEAMVAKLRAKGGDHIPVTMGDFRDFELQTRFRLVYIVFNTFFGLLTQEDQVACFQAVARCLAPDGVFAMEAFVPDLTRFDHGQRVAATEVASDRLQLDVSRLDPIAQRTDTQHIVIGAEGIRRYPVRIRFAYVAELDLMARLAGMRLRERWSDWDRSGMSGESQKHVSVWELAPA